MTGLVWDELETAVRAGDTAAVVAVLAGVPEAERRAVVERLRELRPALDEPTGPDWWRGRADRSAALLLAGAGCLPGAAKVVSWLVAEPFASTRPRSGDRLPEQLVQVLRDRGQPALDKVAAGLAGRLRASRPAAFEDARLAFLWELADAVRSESGAAVPTGDGFVMGWLLARPARRALLADAVRDDPYLDALLPRIMEVDGAGQRLGDGWRYALVTLANEGRLPRGTLLAGCLYRLRAGDRPAALRQVAALHAELAPTLDELAEHRTQYVDLMASPPALVAKLAQESLRALHDAGRLPLDDLLAASSAALLRGEKGLVRRQLDWLDAVAATTDPPDEVLATLATALSHDKIDLAERALEILSRHLPRATDAGRQAVRDAAAHLTGDLRHQASALLDLDPTDAADPADLAGFPAAGTAAPAGPAAGAGAVGPAGAGWEEVPAAIGSVAELVAEVAAMLRHEPDPVQVERVLAGLVRWAAADRPALAAAVEPLLPEWFGGRWGATVELLRAAVGLPARQAPTPRIPETNDEASPFDRMMVGRLLELTDQLRAGPPPELLATPAWTTGHVDPERVLAALFRAEREGWQPGTNDLGQALLRLPREVDPSVRDRAAALQSRAGRSLARWLQLGGLPDPTVSVVRAVPPDTHYHRETLPYRLTTAYQLDDGERAAGLGLPPWLVSLPPATAVERAFSYHWAPALGFWPSSLPSHREVVAAYVLRSVAPAGDEDSSGVTGIVAPLARCHGPFGPGTALAIGYALAARRERDRLPAVDAALTLAAAGDWDGALLGRLLGPLVLDRVITLGRLVAALAEIARSGAGPAVWPVAAALLTDLLPAATRPPGTADLLTLAATTAPAAAAAGTGPDERKALLAVLEPVAEKGSGRLVTEARRLRRTLVG